MLNYKKKVFPWFFAKCRSVYVKIPQILLTVKQVTPPQGCSLVALQGNLSSPPWGCESSWHAVGTEIWTQERKRESWDFSFFLSVCNESVHKIKNSISCKQSNGVLGPGLTERTVCLASTWPDLVMTLYVPSSYLMIFPSAPAKYFGYSESWCLSLCLNGLGNKLQFKINKSQW